MIVAPTRKPAARAALESPYAREHEASLRRRMDAGTMPKDFPALLRWFSEAWTMEVPDRLHTVEVWFGPQQRKPDGSMDWPPELVGGSHLGTPKHRDPFRRYMENYAQEADQDGYYVRPVHAALGRMARTSEWMPRVLFAVAMSGFDWRRVADRSGSLTPNDPHAGWPHEMFKDYLAEALRRLWIEHADVRVRL